MMRTRQTLSLALLLACLQGAPAWAAEAADDKSRATATAHRKAEHQRIRHERDAIQSQRLKDEAVCYRQFAVEDCLKAVRAQVRVAEARLRAQEIDLNDAERKEKAADRLKSIEEKQRPVPAADAAAGGPPGATLRKPTADSQATKAQRDQAAQQRAQQQRSRAQKQEHEQAAHSAESADRAAQARSRHAETLRAAEERRARVEKAKAEAAAKGRAPAAPLPPPSGN